MKSYFIPLFLFGFTTQAAGLSPSINISGSAIESGGFKIEPVIGYETVYRDYPTAHTSTRQVIGVRGALGEDIFSLEGEYTKASDTESYSSAPQQIKNADDTLRVGVRSTYNFNEYFFVSGRGGGQAQKNIYSSTTNGVTTTTENAIRYNPYAGASLGVHFGSYLSLSAGTTIVFKDSTDIAKNDVQNTISLSIGLNK